MGFSRQEYWRGWPFPTPGDLHGPGIDLRLLRGRWVVECLGHKGPLFLGFPSRLCHHGAVGRAPWATQCVLTSYGFSV